MSDDLNDEYIKMLEEASKKDALVLEEVKKIATKEVYQFLEEQLEEFGGYDFKIVNKKLGEEQFYDGVEFWVDQHGGGGFSNDDYYGECYLKIAKRKFIKWSYST